MTQAVTDRANELAVSLAEAAKGFYQRGWALGTSGNFSAVVSQNPLRLVITASGFDKGRLTTDQFVQIDGDGKIIAGEGPRVGRDEAALDHRSPSTGDGRAAHAFGLEHYALHLVDQ